MPDRVRLSTRRPTLATLPRMARAYLALVALLVAACGSDAADTTPAAKVCASGQQVACACADGSTGAQACKADGSGYEACQCGAGGASGSAGASGTSGSSGTGGTSGAGGTAASDPLPAGVYQLSCLWRPLGLDYHYPQNFRIDVPSSPADRLNIVAVETDTPTLPPAAQGDSIHTTAFSLDADGHLTATFQLFNIIAQWPFVRNYGASITLAGTIANGGGCVELTGSIDQTSPGPVQTFDLTPTGDVCLLIPASDGAQLVAPSKSDFDCTP